MIDISCPITVRETAGIQRVKEPVRIGIPFPLNAISNPNELHLIAADGTQGAFQAVTTEYWPNKSVKWAVFDFFAKVSANAETEYSLCSSLPNNHLLFFPSEKVSIKEENGLLLVGTQVATFSLPMQGGLFHSVKVAGEELLDPTVAQVNLCDFRGNLLTLELSQPKVEENGPERCSIVRKGVFKDHKGNLFTNVTVRYCFWAGLSTVQIDCTLHNPLAALHPGGLWDLGDEGSVYFKDFTLQFGLAGEQHTFEWQAEPLEEKSNAHHSNLVLHQNSSGGKNWNSPNHINRHGEKAVSFQGYQITAKTNENSTEIANGLRATPWMKVSNTIGWVAGTVDNFWQDFPKALRTSDNTLQISLFPKEQGQLFELQGGEQKRHTIFIDFGLNGNAPQIKNFQHPIEVLLSPEWIEKSGAISYYTASNGHNCPQYQDYIQNIIEGDNSFYNKREIIDEYGWRNYGDTYADHEAVNHTGPEPFISHYNNQYDFVYGACIHFLMSGNMAWWKLALPAARHMIDIDIYRTDQDKASYNGGLFWHTDHYQEAKTATHRAYSIKNKTGSAYGGGTSNEHIYSSGLTLYYFLTGDMAAKDAVLLLADYVLNMDDGTKTIFALFDEGPSGLASQTVDTAFHHPGRGPGNCISCLIDAYRLSRKRSYLDKAEELIRRCVHPQDDINSLQLDEPEDRWSYLVFFQVLGKYLDYKSELGEADYSFFYSRDSLLHYANWMAEHESPYQEILHKVLIPTETWPAQDIRKCHVFHLAAKYSLPEKRQKYAQKAAFFYSRCLEDLLGYQTAYLTRPLVLLCVYGYVHDYFLAHGYGEERISHCYDFGSPQTFLPQRLRFKKHFVKKLKNTLRIAKQTFSDKMHITKI